MGLQKKSFLLYYSGGEIWVEHLDGLYGYTDLAIEKFEKDYIECKRPSLPALIAINLAKQYLVVDPIMPSQHLVFRPLNIVALHNLVASVYIMMFT